LARFGIFTDPSRRIAEADSVAVVGLGRFGSALAIELMASGTEVLGIDTDEDLVQNHNGLLTQAVRADSTKEEALRQLAVDEFDRVVVAIGDDVQASILTCSILLGMNIPVVWAKAVSEQHGRILEQLGVHHVIYPEADMGRRVAHLVRGAAIDYLEIEPGYSLAKVVAPTEVHGIPLGQTTLRQKHGITVTAFRAPQGDWQNADNQTVLIEGAMAIIVGPTARVEAFAQLR
jgi:trk system potassium uptake protein TrkA